MKIYNCNQNRPYVFISFSHSNDAKVLTDVEKLRELGCNIWIYTADMEAGNNIAQTNAIIRHPNCKAVIFYMCEKSMCSKYCQEELKHAKKFSIPIIPVHCFTPVSGLEESIILLQRTMKNNDDIERSDWLIQEILKTSSGSEVISIPYDTPTHTEKLVQSIKSHCGDDVFVLPNKNETHPLRENKTETAVNERADKTLSAPAPVHNVVSESESALESQYAPFAELKPAPELNPPLKQNMIVEKFCAMCGTAYNSENDSFCLNCGATLKIQPQLNSQTPQFTQASQPQTTYQQPSEFQQQSYVPADSPGKAYATASLVLGIVGIVSAIIPLIGLVLSVIGLRFGFMSKKALMGSGVSAGKLSKNIILNIIGIVCSVIHWIITVVLMYV